MANEEHLWKLPQGVEVWNRWRLNTLWIVPNLSGANLSKTNLRETNLSGQDLSGKDLSGANLLA